MDDEREVLSASECRRLLDDADIGRLGFTSHALPAIEPVRLAVHDGHVIIPARAGGRLATACRGAVVAVQADSNPHPGARAWSLTVVGPSRVVSAPHELAAMDRFGLRPWPTFAVDCYVAVGIALITGWRTPMWPGTDTGERIAEDGARVSA